MNTVTDYMSIDHKHCDEMLAAVENSVKNSRWDNAMTAFKEFIAAMEVHFEMEETILFPAFEGATGSSAGPTAVMRSEHQQMREIFAELRNALDRNGADDFAGVADTLNIMLQQHNMKEEGILYPMADRMLSAGRDAILTEMRQLKEPAEHA